MGERGERAGLQAESDVAHIKEGAERSHRVRTALNYTADRADPPSTHTRVTMQDELSLSLSLGMGGCRYERRAPTPTNHAGRPPVRNSQLLSQHGCMAWVHGHLGE